MAEVAPKFGWPGLQRTFNVAEAIVGAMGPPHSQILTAIGDTVNTAARLEGLTKEYGCPLIISRSFSVSSVPYFLRIIVRNTSSKILIIVGRSMFFDLANSANDSINSLLFIFNH